MGGGPANNILRGPVSNCGHSSLLNPPLTSSLYYSRLRLFPFYNLYGPVVSSLVPNNSKYYMVILGKKITEVIATNSLTELSLWPSQPILSIREILDCDSLLLLNGTPKLCPWVISSRIITQLSLNKDGLITRKTIRTFGGK